MFLLTKNDYFVGVAHENGSVRAGSVSSVGNSGEIGERRRQPVLFNVNLRESLSEGAAYFVVDRAGSVGYVVGCDAVNSVGAHDYDFVT